MTTTPDPQDAIEHYSILVRLLFVLTLGLSATWAIASAILATQFLPSEDGKLVSALLWLSAMFALAFAVTVRKVRHPTPLQWAMATFFALPGLVAMMG
jgi:hypothetical protein